MKNNSKDSLTAINELFSRRPTKGQRAWGVINEFYHQILTYMDENEISRSDLAKKLGKSRAAISQMFNKTPNISVNKMVEIADAIGLKINISLIDIETSQEVIQESINSVKIYTPIFIFGFSTPALGEILSMPKKNTSVLMTSKSDVCFSPNDG
jgi:transcriptional regulator with XRE-family HTH domain